MPFIRSTLAIPEPAFKEKSHRGDSNSEPPLYESGALPIELRWRSTLIILRTPTPAVNAEAGQACEVRGLAFEPKLAFMSSVVVFLELPNQKIKIAITGIS